MFGKVNFSPSDFQLQEIQKELKTKLEKAKALKSVDEENQISLNDNNEICAELEGLQIPEFDGSVNYGEQFWKTYLQNEMHFNSIKETTQKTTILSELLFQIEDLQSEYFRINKLKNRKKNRRLAAEIQKSFTCPYPKCHRFYGSDVSLNLHIKLKHNGGNKTDREKLAEEICLAEEKRLMGPTMSLDLPPGYLNQYRKLYFQRENEAENLNEKNSKFASEEQKE